MTKAQFCDWAWHSPEFCLTEVYWAKNNLVSATGLDVEAVQIC